LTVDQEVGDSNSPGGTIPISKIVDRFPGRVSRKPSFLRYWDASSDLLMLARS
jgi:hypothetical protein